ncbi:FAS1 domain-containing protein [Lindgomyces ingoldianus]|uniref:FAS1 domain-containing protein n=1 Tax=Lindgomyces ingoldianus TaxID=673940 RepID=A0ACB6QBX2_9PLEO|nr:FAS1 domain-containing protein [Lindgomyces ingoldianus]KAF2464396.1 FAS1 domain-containing protein [Lindgomyces ingoldianus]
MKLNISVCILASSLAVCQTVPPGGSDLLAVLRSDPDTQAFAQLLEEHPDLLMNLNSAKNYTVFAPSNAAVATFQQSFNGSLSRRAYGLHRRSIPDYAAAIALLFTDRSNQGNLNLQPTNLITNLTDAEFVNLGPASASASQTTSSFSLIQSSLGSALSASSSVPSATSSSSLSSSPTFTTSISAPVSSTSLSVLESTLVPTLHSQPSTSSPAAPQPTPEPEPAGCPSIPPKPKKKRSFEPYSKQYRRQLNESSLLVSSGFGSVAEASLSETIYNNGAIRKVDSFFTLFGDLASTLQQTNGTAFANSLAQAGMLDSVSKTPRITVFVPTDAVLTGQVLDAISLQRYVLPNTLATSPSLSAGMYKTSAGDSVNITVNSDGSFSVNNATIVKSDVMIKNGVVHYIDNVYTGLARGSAPGLTSSRLSIVVAIAISCSALL